MRYAAVYCFVVALALALAGCAAPATRSVPVQPRTVNSEPTQATVSPLMIREGEKFDTDSEPLFRLLVAEFAGQRGRLDLAVEHYLETARELQDLEIAKRATRIAVFARNNAAALEAAKIWVAQSPTDTEARQILAAMHIREGNAEAAITHLEYVLNAESERANRQLRMIANLLSREEDKRTALAVMDKLMSEREGDVDALMAYALLAIRSEELEKAAQAMARISSAGIGDTNIAMAYVALLQKHDKLLVARDWLESAIREAEDSAGLRLIYARLLADLTHYEEARVQFAILAEQSPDNSDVLYALGLLNLQANRVETAEQNFQQLLELDARNDDANFYLAQIAESQSRYDDALERYRDVLEGDNKFQSALRIALILSTTGRIEEAQAQLRSIETVGEAQALQVIRAEGEILTHHDRYEEAMAVYDAALVDTYDMELLYTRAMLAEKMGRLNVLEADLRRIIEREPENAQALNALGYTLADHTDRYEEAYELIKRAMALNPNDFYILDSMGWVLYRLGRLSEAVEFLERAKTIKDDPEVAAHLGEVLWVMGNKDAARDIWDSALKDTPDDERLRDVIERLTP